MDFELLREDETIASQPLAQTAFSQEETSSFAASNVGTGYSWFVDIREGLGIPIHRHELFFPE